jgi:Asp-tRNA(Asn)/Glu-tRNA(Gln) amidotransferase A subunit family amidase
LQCGEFLCVCLLSSSLSQSSSLDTVGILARKVADVRQVFDVVKGSDGLDSTAEEPEHGTVDANRVAIRVGVSNDFFPHELSEKIVDAWKMSAKLLGWDGEGKK